MVTVTMVTVTMVTVTMVTVTLVTATMVTDNMKAVTVETIETHKGSSDTQTLFISQSKKKTQRDIMLFNLWTIVLIQRQRDFGILY